MRKYNCQEIDRICENASKRAYRANIANRYYSITRNINEFTTNHELNEIIENFKAKYPFDDNGQYYYNILNALNKKIFKENFDLESTLFILINVVDPDLRIYKIYEISSKVADLRRDMIDEFGFYDDRIIKVEKMYIDKYLNEDEFNFSKKLEY